MPLIAADLVAMGKLLAFDWTDFGNDEDEVTNPNVQTVGGRTAINAMKEVVSLLQTCMKPQRGNWRKDLYQLIACFEELRYSNEEGGELEDHEGVTIWYTATAPMITELSEFGGNDPTDSFDATYYDQWCTVQKKLKLDDGDFTEARR